MLILGTTFTLISWNPVNDRVIEPFTGAIARAGGATLSLLGQQTKMNGTIIRNDRFAVNIRNGCNGVEAMLIYFAAVLAFPASWKSRLLGVALGFVAIQLVNLVRVVALFLTGVYFPQALRQLAYGDLADRRHPLRSPALDPLGESLRGTAPRRPRGRGRSAVGLARPARPPPTPARESDDAGTQPAAEPARGILDGPPRAESPALDSPGGRRLDADHPVLQPVPLRRRRAARAR